MTALLLALLWLPLDHPLSGTAEDGCTVQVPAVTVVSSEADRWTITWDFDGRVETHYRSRRRGESWAQFGSPVRFDPDVDTILTWTIRFPEPSPSAIAIPRLALCPQDSLGGYRCVLAQTDMAISGQSLYSRRTWELGREHPELGGDRACPELEEPVPPDPLIFADGLESGDASRWSTAFGLVLFRDGFESGTTARWERSVP